MGVLSMVFLICSVRTNICFVGIFLAYSLAFPLLAASDWEHALGNHDAARTLQIGSGGCCFVVSMLGWYVFLSVMLVSVNFPWSLPVGDLSSLVKGAGENTVVDAEKAKGA